MKIVVLNGSPKGDNSTTLQSIKYLEKHFTHFEIVVHNIGEKISSFEKNVHNFKRIINNIEMCNMVIFLSPVYDSFVPSQLIKFFEIVFEKKVEDSFRGKFASVFLSSNKIMDNFAENYIHQMCDSLEMKFVTTYHSHRDDLFSDDGRANILNFGKQIDFAKKTNIFQEEKYNKYINITRTYSPPLIKQETPVHSFNIALVTNVFDRSSNLEYMIKAFVRLMPCAVNIINLNDYSFSAGCNNCENCVYLDEYCDNNLELEFYKKYLDKADAIIFAFDIKHHYFDYRLKSIYDKTFIYRNSQNSKPKVVGYLVGGPLSREPNLSEYIVANSRAHRSIFAGVATDESGVDNVTTKSVDDLAKMIIWSLCNNVKPTCDYFEKSYNQLFQDYIYDNRHIFKSIHNKFDKNKLYYFDNYHYSPAMFFERIFYKIKHTRAILFSKKTDKLIEKYEKIIDKF